MNRSDLRHAARVIARGGVVAYPTESCYGLGCDPRRHAAVRRLLRLKRRPREMGLILIGARMRQLLVYVDAAQTAPLERARAVWPGPYTWVLPARPGVSAWLRGAHKSIAVRLTAHAGAAALCLHAGSALISTSANRHGAPVAKSAGAVARQFRGEVDFILRGNLGGMDAPSQIRDAVSGELIRG